MALKALMCPQCGASLNLDDTRDFGFCQYCGTKVMLHETIEVKHSGSIKIDNSEQAENLLQLANNCFAVNNYQEAYSYYTKVLEINANNTTALYMRGICAVYISDPQAIKTNEYVHGVTQAKSAALDPDSDVSDQVFKDIEQKSIKMMEYWVDNGLPVQPETNEQGECISEFSKAANVAALASKMVDLLYSEAGKEHIIELALPFIATAKRMQLKYFVGIQTDKKGRTTEVFKPVKVTQEQERILDEADAYLRDAFNNMPSRLEKSGDINTRLNSADEVVEQIKSELKEKKSQRNSKFFALVRDRKNQELKAELAALDQEIKGIEAQLKDAKSVSKDINGELKEFKKTLK